MIVKLLTEHHFGVSKLKGGCRGSSESTLVKMSNCWKSHAAALIIMNSLYISVYTSSTAKMIYSLVIDIQMKEAKKIDYFSLHNKKNGTSTGILLA